LITISYLIGIPAVFIIGGIAAWLKNPKFRIIEIPLIYGFSWLLLMLGLYLAGPKYEKVFSRWTVRVILEKILGEEAKIIRSLSQEGSGKDTTKN
jgi:hypothetical protein